MGKDAKSALATLKTPYQSLPKKAPPYLQKDWDDFVKASDTYMTELARVIDPPDISQSRTIYVTKKAELTALRKKINDSVDKQAAALANVRSAMADILKSANKIGGIVKDKTNEPQSTALGKAIMAFAPLAQRESQGVESPQKVE
jgi:hypothetical protein